MPFTDRIAVRALTDAVLELAFFSVGCGWVRVFTTAAIPG